MDLAPPSTLSGLLEHKAAVDPDHPAISAPGGQKLTVAHINHLVRAAASRLLSSGVQAGDRISIAFGNTAQSAIMILAAMRCGAVAVPMHPAAYTQEEFDFYLSEYKIKLLLTGPPRNDDQTPAQTAAVGRCTPHAVASIDFHYGNVDISSFVLPAGLSAAAGTHGLDVVVNKPWDAALLLHAHGATSPGFSAVVLTQEQLASAVMRQDDVPNLLSELKSCLGDVKLVQNHCFLGNLARRIPATGSLESSRGVALRPSHAAVAAVRNPSLITGEPPHMAGDVSGIAEHDLKLKDILMFSGGAAVGTLAAVLSKQNPQAAAEKVTVPFLLFFLAMNSSYMGEILKTKLGYLHDLFRMGSLFLYICGAASLAVSLLPPAYGYTALAVTAVVGLGTLTHLLQLHMLPRAPPPPPAAAAGAHRVFVSNNVHRIAKGPTPTGKQPLTAAARLDV